MNNRRLAGRGTSVPHRKGTAAAATVKMPAPQKITLMMRQHIGAPSVPVVQKGDHVDVGSVVANAGGFVGAVIHSGVSGTVVGVEKVLTSAGMMEDAVVIESDGAQTVAPEVAPPDVRDRDSFLAAVRASGLVGLGGAGFPTSVKLFPKNLSDIDTIIINAAECEPYITSDDREMLECADTVISGIAAVQKHLGVKNVVIAIERNKPEAIALMKTRTAGMDGVRVEGLKTRYPQGAEKVLIYTVTGREVPAGGLPNDVNVLVMNVTTVSFIGKYLATGMPLVTKRLTVAGGAVANPGNVEVVIGTKVEDIIAFCGGYRDTPAKMLMGGPMMGVALPGDDYPTMKQNNAILALTKAEATVPPPSACIRCGRCISSCPMGLSPVEISEAYEARDRYTLGILSADVCIMCGVCSYVCPAKRLLSPSTNLARSYYLKGVKK